MSWVQHEWSGESSTTARGALVKCANLSAVSRWASARISSQCDPLAHARQLALGFASPMAFNLKRTLQDTHQLHDRAGRAPALPRHSFPKESDNREAHAPLQ